jgi:hypothetical protein
LTPAGTIKSFSLEYSACRSLRWDGLLDAADIVGGHRFALGRAKQDVIFEHMRPDQRYGLFAGEHAEKA